MQLPFKALGILLLLAGGILSVTPQWIHSIPQTIDSYEMIEKRVPYGLFMGIGVFLTFNSSWSSWKLTASFFMYATSIGITIARIIGLFFGWNIFKTTSMVSHRTTYSYYFWKALHIL